MVPVDLYVSRRAIFNSSFLTRGYTFWGVQVIRQISLTRSVDRWFLVTLFGNSADKLVSINFYGARVNYRGLMSTLWPYSSSAYFRKMAARFSKGQIWIWVFEKKTAFTHWKWKVKTSNETRPDKKWNVASLRQINLVSCTKSWNSHIYYKMSFTCNNTVIW